MAGECQLSSRILDTVNGPADDLIAHLGKVEATDDRIYARVSGNLLGILDGVYDSWMGTT
jgi:hypothetical protein